MIIQQITKAISFFLILLMTYETIEFPLDITQKYCHYLMGI